MSTHEVIISVNGRFQAEHISNLISQSEIAESDDVRIAAPMTPELFSVVTDYGTDDEGQIVDTITLEHFPTEQARLDSLRERAEHLVGPIVGNPSEEDLRALLEEAFAPTKGRVILATAVLQADNVYRPVFA